MGYYYGTAFHLPVKKDAPPKVFEFLDDLFYNGNIDKYTKPGSENELIIHGKDLSIEYLSMMVWGHSFYIQSWWWRSKEDRGDHFLYESAASCKYSDEDLAHGLISALLPHMSFQNGEIFFRKIGEDALVESVIYVEDDKLEFSPCGGMVYLDSYDDDRHPSQQTIASGKELHNEGFRAIAASPWEQHRLLMWGDNFTPPWNIKELRMLNENGPKRIY